MWKRKETKNKQNQFSLKNTEAPRCEVYCTVVLFFTVQYFCCGWRINVLCIGIAYDMCMYVLYIFVYI